MFRPEGLWDAGFLTPCLSVVDSQQYAKRLMHWELNENSGRDVSAWQATISRHPRSRRRGRSQPEIILVKGPVILAAHIHVAVKWAGRAAHPIRRMGAASICPNRHMRAADHGKP